MLELPPRIAELVAVLSAIRGAVSVTLGGSRASGDADHSSDWDLGLYYRGEPDLTPIARYGEVHPPGAWGRIMNGGAWLALEGLKVDVLLRDLDVVERFAKAARRGEFEVDSLLGYVAGAPTYSLLAELALSRQLAGELPEAGEFPAALAASAAPRWRFHATFSLAHARMRAARGDLIGTIGQAAKAVVEVGHAILCTRRQWVLNEKRIVERAGLGRLHQTFIGVPIHRAALLAWVEDLAADLNQTMDMKGVGTLRAEMPGRAP